MVDNLWWMTGQTIISDSHHHNGLVSDQIIWSVILRDATTLTRAQIGQKYKRPPWSIMYVGLIWVSHGLPFSREFGSQPLFHFALSFWVSHGSPMVSLFFEVFPISHFPLETSLHPHLWDSRHVQNWRNLVGAVVCPRQQRWPTKMDSLTSWNDAAVK